MGMQTTAKTPAEYLELHTGWVRKCMNSLRASILAAGIFEETLKWGGLVYMSDGPALFVRSDTRGVMLGFWRGQRMLDIEPRLKPGGQYEMATMVLQEGDTIAPAVLVKLVKQAVTLNQQLGNPWDDAKPKPRKSTKKTTNKAVKKVAKKVVKKISKKTKKIRRAK